ncbi:MAG: TonB family protein [Deltaproteobacteria bacterium]
MRSIGVRGPRFFRGAALVISSLILVPPAPVCRAESGAAGAAADTAKSTSPADDKTAAAKDEISRTITAYGKDILDAYYRALIENPKIDGEVVVSFTVRPDGDVADVRIDKSSLNWPPLEEEVLTRIAAWKFSPFQGEPIPATVPYKFHPN